MSVLLFGNPQLSNANVEQSYQMKFKSASPRPPGFGWGERTLAWLSIDQSRHCGVRNRWLKLQDDVEELEWWPWLLYSVKGLYDPSLKWRPDSVLKLTIHGSLCWYWCLWAQNSWTGYWTGHMHPDWGRGVHFLVRRAFFSAWPRCAGRAGELKVRHSLTDDYLSRTCWRLNLVCIPEGLHSDVPGSWFSIKPC